MSDLISRQAAIDKFNRFIERCKEEHTGRVVFTIDDAKYAFTKTVESVESAHGEWEHWGSPFSDESEVIDTIVCSVCGARFIEPKDEPKREYNFYPNCGADMRGEEYASKGE